MSSNQVINIDDDSDRYTYMNGEVHDNDFDSRTRKTNRRQLLRLRQASRTSFGFVQSYADEHGGIQPSKEKEGKTRYEPLSRASS